MRRSAPPASGWSRPSRSRPGRGTAAIKPEGWLSRGSTGTGLALVKIRQPEGRKPKYAEAFRDRPRVYPDPAVIEPGRPLVIVEGEFDALLLGQELRDLAAVVTLGSASSRPDLAARSEMLAAAPWYIATDADEAGDKAASGWPAVAIRVRPPDGSEGLDRAMASRSKLDPLPLGTLPAHVQTLGGPGCAPLGTGRFRRAFGLPWARVRPTCWLGLRNEGLVWRGTDESRLQTAQECRSAEWSDTPIPL